MAQRILYVHGMEAIGGAERDLLLLLGGLHRNRWTPTVACPEAGAFRARVESLGLPVAPITLPPWRKLSSFFSRHAAVRRMRDLLGRLEPALIHVNDIWWAPHTVCAVKGVKPDRIPLIVHVRQNIRPEKVRSYRLDQADVVLAVSNQVRTALEQGGLQSQRVKTLYSGVDLAVGGEQADQQNIRARYAIPPDALVIGTVGNLLPIKGYEVMIEAFPSILAEVPSAHYLIVGAGSGEYSSRLRKLCQERGIADRVHFAGFQERTWPYLSAVDLYVQPSLDEAFGLAAVEAMVAGKAVVASRVGGLPEVVEQDQTGILVVPSDPSELSRAIVSLLRDGARRGQMGARGAARARERFDHRAVVKATEQIYQAVLAGMGSA